MRPALVLALVLGGCDAEVSATNPFDPGTPAAQQAPGSIRAEVLLPAGFASDRFEGASAELWSFADAAAPAQSTDLQREAEGASLLFESVPAGSYELRVSVEGFEPTLRVVEVEVGADLDLGVLQVGDAARGLLRGTALLEGAASHEGTTVAAVGTPDVAITDEEGHFELRVVLGRHDLRFSHEGFGLQSLTGVRVEAEPSTLPETVTLSAAPGRIAGSVGFPAGFGSHEALGEVDVALLEAGDAECNDEAGPEGASVQQVRPDAEGRFAFDQVGVGRWCVALRAEAFLVRRALALVEPGATTRLERVELAPAPADAVVLGVARIEGGGELGHGGIRVEVDGWDPPVETTGEGRYRFELPGDASYTIRFRLPGYSAEPIEVRDLPKGGEVEVPEALLRAEPGRIRGVVALAAGFDPELLAQVRVSLFDLDVSAAEAVDTAVPVADGSFVFDALAPGAYVLHVEREGFEPVFADAVLAPGEVVELGQLVLRPGGGSALVSGTVQLSDAMDHGGVRVEVLGEPSTEVTSSEGRFRIAVLPGEAATLLFNKEGYGQAEEVIPAEALQPGFVHVIEAPVRLTGEPAVLRGSVRLLRFASPERLARVRVELSDDPDPQAEPLQNIPVAAEDGSFVLRDVGAGTFYVRATATGYLTDSRRLLVGVGEDVDVGPLVLDHESRTARAVPFDLQVLLRGRARHEGSLVRVRLDSLPFGDAFTDVSGGVQFAAARTDRLRVTVERPGWVGVEDEGPYVWVEDPEHPSGGAFRHQDRPEAPATIELEPARNATLVVPIEVEPDWLPQAQRFARVRVEGPIQRVLERVEHGAQAEFRDLEDGRYVVTVDRDGFGSVQQVVEVSREQEAPLAPIRVRLERIASAALDLDGVTVDACALRGVDARGGDLSGAVLTGAFGPSEAPCANCDGACEAVDLSGATLTNAALDQANLRGALLEGASLLGARLAGVDLRGAVLRFANLFGADLSCDEARCVQLGGADLSGANLSGANLRGAALIEAGEVPPAVPCGLGPRPAIRLSSANLSHADLTGISAAGIDLRDVMLSGARLADADLHQSCLAGVDLTLIDLGGARLDRADLSEAVLTNAILDLTSARGARFDGASLISAIVERAQLDAGEDCEPRPFVDPEGRAYEQVCSGDARWLEPGCCRTTLRGANLNGANLVGARLDDADLAGATLLDVTVGDAAVLPEAQPGDCAPELLADCVDGCAVHEACLPEVPVNCVSASAACADTGRVDLELQSRLRCLADGFAALGGCDEALAGCLDEADAQPEYPRRDAVCTWDTLDACEAAHVPPECTVTRTVLARARLDGAQLVTAVLAHADLTDARLVGADLRLSAFFDVSAEGVDLRGVDLERAVLSDADLDGTDLSDARATRADLRGASLVGTVLDGAVFSGATLVDAQLSGSTAARTLDLTEALVERGTHRGFSWPGADLTGAVFRDLSLDAFSLRNAKLDETRLETVNLGGPGDGLRDASLRGAKLRQVQLAVDMTGADLLGADLDAVDLSEATLDGASFAEARLVSVDLREIEAEGLSLADARLEDSPLTRCTLERADLSRAVLSSVDLERCTLSASSLRDATLLNPRLRFTVMNGDLRGLRIAPGADSGLLEAESLQVGPKTLNVVNPVPAPTQVEGASFEQLLLRFAIWGDLEGRWTGDGLIATPVGLNRGWLIQRGSLDAIIRASHLQWFQWNPAAMPRLVVRDSTLFAGEGRLSGLVPGQFGYLDLIDSRLERVVLHVPEQEDFGRIVATRTCLSDVRVQSANERFGTYLVGARVRQDPDDAASTWSVDGTLWTNASDLRGAHLSGQFAGGSVVDTNVSGARITITSAPTNPEGGLDLRGACGVELADWTGSDLAGARICQEQLDAGGFPGAAVEGARVTDCAAGYETLLIRAPGADFEADPLLYLDGHDATWPPRCVELSCD